MNQATKIHNTESAPPAILRLLIVDDDAGVRQTLSEALRLNGFDVDVAQDSAELAAAMARRRYDLVVIDLRLKDESGYTLAHRLRASSRLPIMMISGASSEDDRVRMLELAADDFLIKPFGVREFVARVRAVLRRSGPSHDASVDSRGQPEVKGETRNGLSFGPWILNTERRQLYGRDRQPCSLTPSEYQLLETFVSYPGRMWSRDELLERTRSADSEVYDRVIDVLILRLRRKIESNPRQPQYICTERGQGYIFKADVVRL